MRGAKNRIEVSLLLVDLSGFTGLLYQAQRSPAVANVVEQILGNLFGKSARAVATQAEAFVINTTGDGFFVALGGATPSRSALQLARIYKSRFDASIRAIVGRAPVRCRVDLRVALHHGAIAWQDAPILSRLGSASKIYYGDDLNLLARLVDSGVARKGNVAASREFYRRVLRAKERDLPPAAEIILDRNKYPEPIEVYRGDELFDLLDTPPTNPRRSTGPRRGLD